jgi:hypothetical protein
MRKLATWTEADLTVPFISLSSGNLEKLAVHTKPTVKMAGEGLFNIGSTIV